MIGHRSPLLYEHLIIEFEALEVQMTLSSLDLACKACSEMVALTGSEGLRPRHGLSGARFARSMEDAWELQKYQNREILNDYLKENRQSKMTRNTVHNVKPE